MSVRSLHVATSAGWRGGEQQVLYLLEGLCARGDRPVLASPAESVLRSRAARLPVDFVPVAPRGDLDIAAAIRLRSALGGIEVLHLHTARAHAIGILAVRGMRPRPGVVVSRRVDFPLKGGAMGALKYRTAVDRFVAVSDRVASVLRGGGVRGDRVVTVHSGIDPSRFDVPRDPDGVRAETAIPKQAKLVGFVGALVNHKAPGDLLEAAALLPPEVHVLVVGEGPLERSLRRRGEAADLSGRVHFLGRRDDVPRLLRSIDVFCLPSREEGLGTSVLDAMAAETPVVAAAGGGIPEMVEPEISGLLVPPGDPPALARALGRVLGDRDLARRLGAGGKTRVREFTASRMVEETAAVYEAVLAERKARADRSGKEPRS
jgi:glycosyltransferase involved in cell wall biosynthesis